ncbi:hypothetical protein VIGAN_03169400 [Vigna angularis var. angularis]|uniref:Uncharacterized protein n=1 Tax=Vigna angularis var. angularis TaxID=157739 RepID=A0A0S3RMP8_PHAAN|nr:hypothetical protein VIGAN_03169400 [Vigna angularis var. angularis]
MRFPETEIHSAAVTLSALIPSSVLDQGASAIPIATRASSNPRWAAIAAHTATERASRLGHRSSPLVPAKPNQTQRKEESLPDVGRIRTNKRRRELRQN